MRGGPNRNQGRKSKNRKKYTIEIDPKVMSKNDKIKGNISRNTHIENLLIKNIERTPEDGC